MLDLDTIKEAGKFIVKWGGAGYTGADANNKQSPGWMLETQEDSFIARLDEKTSLMKDATFIKMEARQHSIEYLFVRPNLQPMSTNGGLFNADLSTLTETIPLFARTELDARPFVAFTYTPKQFIWENIAKADFLGQYEAMLAETCGVSAESLAVYSDKSTGGSFDGILKQLKSISELTEEEKIRENGKGYYGAIDLASATDSIVSQFMDMITSFADQKGNLSNAVIYTSIKTRGAILKEASNRETDLGDAIYLNGNDISIYGVPVKTADFLNRPAEGYGEKAIMCDPKSVVFGFVQDIESESTYEHTRKSYLSSVDLEFDVGFIYPVDVLYADIKNGLEYGGVKNELANAVTLTGDTISAAITINAGATNNKIPVGTYNYTDGQTTPVTGTVKVTKDKISKISP